MPEANIVIAKRYYPRLSEVITIEDLPEFLSFAQDGLNAIFDKIHYKNLQYSKSPRGDSAFYSLDIVSKQIGLNLPFGLRFVLNPDEDGDSKISSFPITLEYQWEILAFLRSFNFKGFSFTPEAFYELGLQIFRVSETEVMAHTLNYFVEPVNDTTSKYEQLLDDINLLYPAANLALPTGQEPTVSSVVALINQSVAIPKSISALMFVAYVLDTDLDVTKKRLQDFYNLLVPEGIEEYIRKLIIPRAKATLELSAAIEFPNTILQPVTITGTAIPGKTIFKFAEATLYVDTEGGIGYQAELAGSLIPEFSQIGNTGLIISFTNAKLDLSSTRNIPEADAAGYPNDFRGLYIQSASISLTKFGKNDTSQTSAGIFAENLLVGTGGVSGTIGLQSNGKLYRKFGDRFAAELNEFSITFRQGAIINSFIAGKLTVPKFKRGGGAAIISIQAEIRDNGDFTISALPEDAPYKITLPNVFDLYVRSLTLGNVGNNYFIAIAGQLDFIADIPLLGQVLPKGIEIRKLLIWDNGKIEFEGGGLTLPVSFHLNAGPVKLEVSNLSLGGGYRRNDREYQYFGFDGMVNAGTVGIGASGNGIKYYFSVDDGNFDHFLSIDGIAIDLAIPGNVDRDKAAFLLHGYLSMKNPGSSGTNAAKEYTGSVDFSMPKIRFAGSAGMRLQPAIPAFVVDIGMEMANPVPIGSTGLGIYGFRGLIGQHYMPSKSATTPPLPDNASWWDYFKAPSTITGKEGIEIDKFESKPGFSIGAGASIATQFDSGKTFSSKLFLLLGLPDVFLVQGQAAILRERLGLDDQVDPPFTALIIFGDQSVRGNLSVDYQLPEDGAKGAILDLKGSLDFAFYFNNASGWYLNVGKDLPESERVRARVLTLFQGHAYLMLSSRGIKAGAGAKFDFNQKYGPLAFGFGAYLNLGGFISFKPVQLGGFIEMGGYAYVRFWKISLGIAVALTLSAEAPHPFIIRGSVELSVKIVRRWVFKVQFEWVINGDRTPLQQPIEILALPNPEKGYLPAVAVNMLSNETFRINYANGSSTTPPAPDSADWEYDFTSANEVKQVTIPIDSFIDIELLKPVKPNNLLGGAGNQVPDGYAELLPPQRGNTDQVLHEFELTGLEIKAWANGAWHDYNIFEAVTAIVDRNTGSNQVNLSTLKPGYWQFMEPGRYSKIRLMSQHMFSFSSEAAGASDLDNSNFNKKDVFCADSLSKEVVVNWVQEPANTVYAQSNYSFKNSIFNFKNVLASAKPAAGLTANSLYLEGEKGQVTIRLPEPVSVLHLNFGENSNEVDVAFIQTEFKHGPFGISIPKYKVIDGDSFGSNEQDRSISYESETVPIDTVLLQINNKPLQDYIGDLVIGGHYQLPEGYLPPYLYGFTAETELSKALMFAMLYNDNLTSEMVRSRSLMDDHASLVSKWPMSSALDIKGELTGILNGDPGLEEGYYTTYGDELIAQNVYHFEGNADALVVPYDPVLKVENGSFAIEVTAIFNPFETGAITLLSKVYEDAETGYRKGYTLHLCQFTPGNKDSVYTQLANIPSFKVLLTVYNGDQHSTVEATDLYAVNCDGYLTEKQYKTIVVSVDRSSNDLDIYIDRILKLNAPIPAGLAVFATATKSTYLNELSYIKESVYKRLKANGITEAKLLDEVQRLEESINKVVQPVWRPNTTYAVVLKTMDKVDGIATPERSHIFGFKTAGPLGHFHHQNIQYQGLKEQDREAEFKLSGLKPYIDYERSSPDAQGRFDLSKPVFYQDPQINLFFTKPYVYAMYSDWNSYLGLPELESKLKIELADPLGEIISPQLVWDPVQEISVTSAAQLGKLSAGMKKLFRLKQAAAACNPAQQPIKKRIQKGHYVIPNLLPQKLYTAIFKASYNASGPSAEPLESEVHKFGFKTSRYQNFAEQAGSFVLNAVPGQEEYAIYAQSTAFNTDYVNNQLKKLINSNEEDDPAEVLQYAVKFDRLLFGGFKVKSLEKTGNTFVRLFVNTDPITNLSKILGLLVRSSEPFNDPKLPSEELDDTVNMELTLPNNSVIAGSQFIYIHSRDTSSVFITNAAMDIPLGSLKLNFFYKVFDGEVYEIGQEYHSPLISLSNYLDV